ncbi:pyridoxamine 5'-phosphate oxidase [Plantactinospora sp. KBS50]|nr:pyridoxamine 5'-phosphate oxidase [Plantactinospora sp. KBS50]
MPSLDPAVDPFQLFAGWLREAEDAEVNDANAMALATVGPDGLPDVRMVLLKGFDRDGFVFYTNSESRKGGQLAGNMQAAGALHWKSLRRQVRFRGPVEFATEAEADAYFASRARDSRIGAWASRQSRTLADRSLLEAAVARETDRFDGREVPRPPRWKGYRVRPLYLEFWVDRPFRLHHRLVYRRDGVRDDWQTELLQP